MKNIEQYVRTGISTLEELQAALKVAMQLEFSTIPPYLCAEWSIKTDHDGVRGMIHDIVIQEMYHFALAGNMLTAIGGAVDVANAMFIPSYPTDELPGGIPQVLPVDLHPLSMDQLAVFMQIEYPEFPPVALGKSTGPATIGEFYDAIASGFSSLNPTFDPNAFFVDVPDASPIRSAADAQLAIARIKGEGEGTPGSPDQPPDDAMLLAHYYVFKQIFLGKGLIRDSSGKWTFSGPNIMLPESYNFSQSKADAAMSAAFNQALTELLIGLQECWTAGTEPDVGAMGQLGRLGRTLIKAGIRPDFLWDSSTAT
ncbi:ferritin-like protein [Mesorhizobium sp. M0751]|uniref:ferritin-like domain-containing protein n=1 Tax=unclassified Mesorhizobium TaxID=325217 RepID=UPI003337F137